MGGHQTSHAQVRGAGKCGAGHVWEVWNSAPKSFSRGDPCFALRFALAGLQQKSFPCPLNPSLSPIPPATRLAPHLTRPPTPSITCPLLCSQVCFVSLKELRPALPGPLLCFQVRFESCPSLDPRPPRLHLPPAVLFQVRFVSLSELRQEFFTPETLPTQFRR